MKRILIIDDSDFARMTLRLMLQENGYEVCGEAGDGQQGIEKYKQLKPDLTLCDIRMNGMSGLDCIRTILSEDPGAKVLVCAAINSDDKMEQALKLGVLGVVKKPIHIDELMDLVQKALSKRPETINYKALMEERAAAAGIGLNLLLNFYSAFQSISGLPLDDPQVDRQYLIKNGEGILIGMRALLSARIPLAQRQILEQIFQEFIDSIE